MKLIIQNETGHTTMEVNASGVIEQINDHPTHWVIVDDVMVMRENIPDVSQSRSISICSSPLSLKWALHPLGSQSNYC